MTSVDGLIPVSMAMLSPKISPGVDIYLKSNTASKAVLYCSGSDLPELSRLKSLMDEGPSKIFIDRQDRDAYQQYLRENWQDLIEDESQPVANRMAVMSEVMRDVLSEEFASKDTGKIVDASQQLGRASCELIGERPIVVRQLSSVLHHDYATFTHCANVSMFAVLLARKLGFSPAEQEEVAIGALVHDLGKLHVDDRILNKPARLDEFEFREIQKHPLIGFSELCHRNELSFPQLMMTYQHHERLNGTGYPVGCTAEEIHPYAKICAIVDVYEALTAQRPYRQPASSKTALAILSKGAGTEFDSEMLQCWHELVQTK